MNKSAEIEDLERRVREAREELWHASRSGVHQDKKRAKQKFYTLLRKLEDLRGYSLEQHV